MLRRAVMLAVLLAPKMANAAPSQSLRDAVHVHPGVTCLEEDAVREHVRSWLETDSVDGDLRVEIEGSREDPRFVAFDLWQGDRLLASRRFAPGPAECGQLHAVLGLAIALALKVSLREELFGEQASRPDRGHGWWLGAGALATFDVVPGMGGGLFIWAEKAFANHFSAQVGLSGLLGQSAGFEAVAGEFSTRSVALDAAGCVHPALAGGVHGRLCTGLSFRALRASGSGFAVSKSTFLDWLSLSNSVGITVDVTERGALVGSVALVLPLERVRLAVAEPGGQVVESRDFPPAGGAVSLGWAYEF